MQTERQLLAAALQRAEARRRGANLAPHALIVEPLDNSNRLFAAVDADGAWTLVVVARKSGKPIPVLKLSALSANYGAIYKLHKDEAIERLRVSVLRCGTTDPAVRTLFVAFCVALLEGLPDDPSDGDLEQEVSNWIALFWRLQTPARTTVVGLIGELTLLDKVEHLADWVRAWHSAATDNLDFAFASPPLSVEVKATSSQQRVHELSMNQAEPQAGGEHFFASVIVELREAGIRLGDVVDELAETLAGTAESQFFWRVLAEVCGSSLSDFFEVRYMREVARETLQFYAADALPQPVVQLPLPAGVSGVRFRSDFSSVEPLDPTTVLSVAIRDRSRDDQ